MQILKGEPSTDLAHFVQAVGFSCHVPLGKQKTVPEEMVPKTFWAVAQYPKDILGFSGSCSGRSKLDGAGTTPIPIK